MRRVLTQKVELEAQLRSTPDLATIAVYSDVLIDEGDPLGDQIAIELRTPQRHPLLLRWIASHLQAASCDNLELTGEASIPFLNSPLGDFCRGVTAIERTGKARALVTAIARKPRPFMTRLKLTVHSDGPLVLDERHVCAMPNLTELELDGDFDMSAFRHPRVKQLTRGAWSGGLKSWALGIDLPGCTELVVDVNLWVKTVRPKDVTFESLPALRTLDVSAGEPRFIPEQDRHDRTNLDVFEWLAQLPLVTRLERVRVPSIRTSDDVKALKKLIVRAPNLEIDVMRMYTRCRAGEELASHRIHFPTPWPWLPDDMLHDHHEYTLLAPGAKPLSMLSGAIADGLERVFAERGEAFREDWRTIWRAIDACEKKPQQLPFDLIARGFRGFPVEHMGSAKSLRNEVLALESLLEPHQLVTIQPKTRVVESPFARALAYVSYPFMHTARRSKHH